MSTSVFNTDHRPIDQQSGGPAAATNSNGLTHQLPPHRHIACPTSTPTMRVEDLIGVTAALATGLTSATYKLVATAAPSFADSPPQQLRQAGLLGRRPINTNNANNTNCCNNNFNDNKLVLAFNQENADNFVDDSALINRDGSEGTRHPGGFNAKDVADSLVPGSAVDQPFSMGGKESIQQLKKSLTLNFASPDSLKKSLATPEILSVLRFTSPDFEKFFTHQVATGSTPTPTQIFNPSNVTTEQEQYARGFIDALNQLHSLRGACLPALLSPGFVASTIQQQQLESANSRNEPAPNGVKTSVSMEQLLRTLASSWTPTGAAPSAVFASPTLSTPTFGSTATSFKPPPDVDLSSTVASSLLPSVMAVVPSAFTSVVASTLPSRLAAATSAAAPNTPALPPASVAVVLRPGGLPTSESYLAANNDTCGAAGRYLTLASAESASGVKRTFKVEAPEMVGDEVVLQSTPEVTLGPAAGYFVTLSSAGVSDSPPPAYRRKRAKVDVVGVIANHNSMAAAHSSTLNKSATSVTSSYVDVETTPSLTPSSRPKVDLSTMTPLEHAEITVVSSSSPQTMQSAGDPSSSSQRRPPPRPTAPASPTQSVTLSMASSLSESDDDTASTSTSASPALSSTLPPGVVRLDAMDPRVQERLKLERKRARNRLAATRCRRRKLEVIAGLSDRVLEMSRCNKQLEDRVRDCRANLQALKKRIEEHRACGCKV